ncbi:MAG: hypothetical protein JXB10_20550 [Pirellulales bacterium]|nr:hypothetical protein [Pirellulales bacterium]
MKVSFSDNRNPSKCILWIGFVLLTSFFAGCGDGRPKRVPVSGRVLIDGRPLEVGFIRVVPQKGRPATGPIEADGRFRLKTYEDDDGCVPGTHGLMVVGSKNIGETAIQWFAPEKYASIKTSGLQLKVNGPRNDVEIHLTWKGSGHDGPYKEIIE